MKRRLFTFSFALACLALGAAAQAQSEREERLQKEHKEAMRGYMAVMEERGLVTPLQVSDAVEAIKKANQNGINEETEAFLLGLSAGAVNRLSLFYDYREDYELALRLAKLYCRLVRTSQEGLRLSDDELNIVLGDHEMRKVIDSESR